MIKFINGNILRSKECVLKRWNEYFEVFRNEEKGRERGSEVVEIVNRDIGQINKEEMRRATRRMKKGKSR